MTREGWNYINSEEFKNFRDAVGRIFDADPHPQNGHTVPEMQEILKRMPLPPKLAGKVYHGPVSGAFTHLSQDTDRIVRLKEKRNGHSIYVHKDVLGSRDHYKNRGTVKPKKQAKIEAGDTGNSSGPHVSVEAPKSGLPEEITPEMVQIVAEVLILDHTHNSQGRAFRVWVMDRMREAQNGNVRALASLYRRVKADREF